MRTQWIATDRLGLLKTSVDAHVLGITAVEQLVSDCDCPVVIAPETVSAAAVHPEGRWEAAAIEAWIREQRITHLGFSYRLDPDEGAGLFCRLVRQLERLELFAEHGGPLRAVHFAGLSRTCDLVRARVPRVSGLFDGEETAEETLEKLGIRSSLLPPDTEESLAYDRDRLAFGLDLVKRERYRSAAPVDHGGYPGFGTEADSLLARLAHARRSGLLPLTRAHMGPYLPDREEAVRLFLREVSELASGGHLDVLSIGTSQLTQSRFGEDWGGDPNGGGVPLNSAEEFRSVYRAARPMLVRSYAGARDLPVLARMLEDTIHNAWHALSLWWFSRMDGRGPNTVTENLRESAEALRYIASVGTPYEPNVSHHFAFRGADDATCIVAAWQAARFARAMGVRALVTQVMLSTPGSTWGVQDLAKARVLLKLLRELEDGRFTVVLQTRAGLDSFSADPLKAQAQLAAATALMDDIEPHDPSSPHIVHVVSWSEAIRLADPSVIAESVQITHAALAEYRRLRARGLIDDMDASSEVLGRTRLLLSECRKLIAAIEARMDPCSLKGLYEVLSLGFFAVPYLWNCREEFRRAVDWRTRPVKGAVRIVDENGVPLSPEDRVGRVLSASVLPDPQSLPVQ